MIGLPRRRPRCVSGVRPSADFAQPVSTASPGLVSLPSLIVRRSLGSTAAKWRSVGCRRTGRSAGLRRNFRLRHGNGCLCLPARYEPGNPMPNACPQILDIDAVVTGAVTRVHALLSAANDPDRRRQRGWYRTSDSIPAGYGLPWGTSSGRKRHSRPVGLPGGIGPGEGTA